MRKDLIGYFSCDPKTGAPVWDEGCVCGDNIFSLEGTGTVGRPIMFADDPVAAQPDVTQQTLDDVMAGIPARDAEIEALRKEIEMLRAQLIDRSPEMQGTPVDESSNLQSQQQPVSGADGLPPCDDDLFKNGISVGLFDIPKHDAEAITKGIAVATGARVDWHYIAGRVHIKAAPAQTQPSGNSGELDEREAFESWWVGQLQHAESIERLGFFMSRDDEGRYNYYGLNLDWKKWKAGWRASRAALAQQDADKVDAALAEMVHAMFRSGNSVSVTRITIDRKQYDAAIDAARKEPDQ